jgi:hypothetical protein
MVGVYLIAALTHATRTVSDRDRFDDVHDASPELGRPAIGRELGFRIAVVVRR